MKKVLSIAGSDSSAGAGIQADLKTITAIGGYAATVITAVTAQNTQGVSGIHVVPAEVVRQQIDAVMSDLEPDAIKIGMLPDVATVQVVIDALSSYEQRPVVLDPVMISTSGTRLMSSDAVDLCVSRLMPLCTLITPNLPEAEQLTGMKISSVDDMETAARLLHQRLRCSVVVKGGHLNGNEPWDVLYHEHHTSRHLSPAVVSRNTHGTGCTFSSAIATYIALGCTVEEAVSRAKHFVYNAILSAKDRQIGHGHGPIV